MRDVRLQRFVDCFQRLDDSICTHQEPPPPELNCGPDPNDANFLRWKAVAIKTSPDELKIINGHDSLPELYRQLVLSYRWLTVDLRILRLFGNPPGVGLQPLANLLYSDPVMNNTLDQNGLLRFGLASDSYDPICFDLNRATNGECPVVRLNHESILMHDRIGEVSTIFDTFGDLVSAVLGQERQ